MFYTSVSDSLRVEQLNVSF